MTAPLDLRALAHKLSPDCYLGRCGEHQLECDETHAALVRVQEAMKPERYCDICGHDSEHGPPPEEQP